MNNGGNGRGASLHRNVKTALSGTGRSGTVTDALSNAGAFTGSTVRAVSCVPPSTVPPNTNAATKPLTDFIVVLPL